MCTFHGVKEWDEWQVSISKKTGTALSKAALKKKKKKRTKQNKLTGHPESCTDTNRLQYSGTGPPSLVRLAKGKRHRVHTVE